MRVKGIVVQISEKEDAKTQMYAMEIRTDAKKLEWVNDYGLPRYAVGERVDLPVIKNKARLYWVDGVARKEETATADAPTTVNEDKTIIEGYITRIEDYGESIEATVIIDASDINKIRLGGVFLKI